jgi:hypothetical protein
MNNNAKLIDELREVIAFLEERPDFPSLGTCYTFYAFVRGDDNLKAMDELRNAAKMMNGCKKSADAEWFNLTKEFGVNGAGARIQVTRSRDKVCERVKVGEEVIPAQPERVEPEKVIPAAPERVVEKFEWRCPESLLAAK